MKKLISVLLLSIGLTAFASAQTAAPASAPASAPALPPQPADVPAIKVDKDGKPNATFMSKHDSFIERAKQGDIDLIFLGDSITQGWGSNGKKVYQEQYADKYKIANFGISGDRTQHVLWRIQNGELEGIKPKVVVLMIGTNNSNTDSAESIESGIEKIVSTIREKTGAKVLLLGIFPRGPSEEKAGKARAKLQEINKVISKLDDGKNVRYLDLWDKFLEPDKTISPEMMKDALHPGPKGYQIWADSMNPLLEEMMAQK
jgi:lysophospholipase L1-like esterase